jgi:DedD protein
MAESQDTEITLGTGKMLVLFFGLVALCSAFFALGYKFGRNSGGESAMLSPTVTTGGARPSTTKPATTPNSDLTFYKSVSQDNSQAQLSPPEGGTKAAPAEGTQADPTTPTSSGGYFVQVAAVSKQEDADALVDALKKKQYAAFATTLADKLIHVQVGPFGDIKEAEGTRSKLVADGYNPILKK